MTDLHRPVLAGGEVLRDPEVALSRGPQTKFHPYSLEQTRERLTTDLETASRRVAEIPQDRRGERVIAEVTIVPNYLAGSWFPTELLEETDLTIVGARPGRADYVTEKRESQEDYPTKTLQVAATDQSFEQLAEILASTSTQERIQKVQNQARRLDSVLLPGEGRLVPHDATTDAPADWEAILHPAVNRLGELSEEERGKLLALWAALVNTLGGEADLDYARVAGGLTFLPVTIEPRSAQRALEFNPLRILQPMPALAVEPDASIPPEKAVVPQPPAEGVRSEVAIALFDQGVDDSHHYLNGYVATEDLTDRDVTSDGLRHGTMTASAALHGPLLPGRDPGSPPASVHHFRVGPAPVERSRATYWTLDQIIDTLRARSYSIASIGIGINRALADDSINSWTWRLDQVAEEEDVLILIPAGNKGTPDPRPADGSDRVRVPADGANLLSVGAAIGDADSWQRAPYCCRGPGRGGARIQPRVMSFGGDDSLPFYAAAPGNEIDGSSGTSFAAPTVARSLAELYSEIDIDHSVAATLRAFAVHFASEADVHDVDDHGFGLLPGDLPSILECGSDSITVLYQDTLDRGDAVAYPLPVPPRDLDRRWSVRWTLSFMSPVDFTDSFDYTTAGLEVFFRPNAARVTMNPPPGSRANSKSVDSRRQRRQHEELLDAGWTPSGAPVSRSAERLKSEHELRDEGKWETVIRQADSMLGKTLYQPRIWLNYLARSQGVLRPVGTGPQLGVALLITIDGPSGSNLYEEVITTAPFDVLTPLTTQIRVPT